MKILKGQTFDDPDVAGQRGRGDPEPVHGSIPLRRRRSNRAARLHEPSCSDASRASALSATHGRCHRATVASASCIVPIESVGRAILAVRVADSVSPDVVRQPVDAIVGRQPAGRVRTIAEALDLAIARERLLSGVALFLAALVVLIGCVGLYALMTYDVERRRRELGIRLALGATARGRSRPWCCATGPRS